MTRHEQRETARSVPDEEALSRRLSGFRTPFKVTRRQFAFSAGVGLSFACDVESQELSPAMPIPSGKVRILLDTDAGNYFDDQFALAYAARSPEAVSIESIYAAPFVNRRAGDPATGVDQSYESILRVVEALNRSQESAALEDIPVLKGAREWLQPTGRPERTPAATDIVERVLADTADDLYIVAIGPATNVAAALLLEPSLARRAKILWLGGTPHHFPSAEEFNLRQDPVAARVLFESGVRLMHFPAPGLAENLRTTHSELQNRLESQSAIGDHLLSLVDKRSPARQPGDPTSQTLAIWDMAPVAWLVQPDWVQSAVVNSPQLDDALEWHQDGNRHSIRVAIRILRDEVFTDFFSKIRAKTG